MIDPDDLLATIRYASKIALLMLVTFVIGWCSRIVYETPTTPTTPSQTAPPATR